MGTTAMQVIGRHGRDGRKCIAAPSIQCHVKEYEPKRGSSRQRRNTIGDPYLLQQILEQGRFHVCQWRGLRITKYTSSLCNSFKIKFSIATVLQRGASKTCHALAFIQLFEMFCLDFSRRQTHDVLVL